MIYTSLLCYLNYWLSYHFLKSILNKKLTLPPIVSFFLCKSSLGISPSLIICICNSCYRKECLLTFFKIESSKTPVLQVLSLQSCNKSVWRQTLWNFISGHFMSIFHIFFTSFFHIIGVSKILKNNTSDIKEI